MGDKGDSTPAPSTTTPPVSSGKPLKADVPEFVPGAFKLAPSAPSFVPSGGVQPFVPVYNPQGGNYMPYNVPSYMPNSNFPPQPYYGSNYQGGRRNYNNQGSYMMNQQQYMHQQQAYMSNHGGPGVGNSGNNGGIGGGGAPMPIPQDSAQPVGPDGAVISNQDIVTGSSNGNETVSETAAVPPPEAAKSAVVETPVVTGKVDSAAATADTPSTAKAASPVAAKVSVPAAKGVETAPTETTAASASEWGRGKKDKKDDKAEAGDAKTDKGEKGGWARGEKINNPDSFKKDDGKLRYDKVTMFTQYKPHSYCIPQCVKEYYEKFGIHERCPLGYEPFRKQHRGGDHSYIFSKDQANNVLEKEYKEEAAAMFSSEKLKEGFHYDPNRLKIVDAGDHAAQMAVTINKANLTLNKLSVEKFDKLSDEFLSLGLHLEEELMNKTVDMIVKKAQLQQPFAFMYANLCQKITTQWNEIVVEEKEKAAAGTNGEEKEKEAEEPNTYGKMFRAKLLSRCQDEFNIDRFAALEAIRTDPDLSEEDKEEKELLAKMKFNGHMRFVGEIYMYDLIRPNTMVTCLKEFLQTPDEQNLVCMVKLFETLGKKLEDYYVARRKTRHFAEIFDTIEGLLANKEAMTSRMRYLLKDLIDLRASNWVPRIKALKATTKAEIQKEADVANGVAGKRPAAVAGNKKVSSFSDVREAANRSPKPQSPMRSSSAAPEDSGWETVAGKKKDAVKPRAGAGDVRGKTTTVVKPTFGAGAAKFGATSTGKSKPAAKGASGKGGFGALSVDTDGGNSPAPDSEEAFTPVGGQTHRVGHVPDEIASKLKAAANEFIADPAAVEDVCSDIEKLFQANDQLPSASVKWFLNYVMDKQDAQRVGIADLFNVLVEHKLLSSEALTAGIYLFLNDSEDAILDCPQLLSYLAQIVARCNVVYKIVSLTIFASIPEENAFHMLGRTGDLWAALLHQVSLAGSVDLAKEQYKELAIDFSEYVMCGPREDKKEALANFLKKHKINDIIV